MERAETKVSVHSSHHTPLENYRAVSYFFTIALGLKPRPSRTTLRSYSLGACTRVNAL